MQHNDILNIFEFSDNNRIYDSSIIRNNQKLLNLFNSSMIILPASLFKNIEEDGGKIRLHTNDQFKSFKRTDRRRGSKNRGRIRFAIRKETCQKT